MTAAAEQRIAGLAENLQAARENARRLIAGLRKIPGAWIFPSTREDDDPRYSPYIVSAGFPPLPAEIVVRIADGRGIAISAGSACSSRKKDRTRVPESMGVPHETALSAIRISIGASTTPADIDMLLSALKEEIPPVLAISKGRAG